MPLTCAVGTEGQPMQLAQSALHAIVPVPLDYTVPLPPLGGLAAGVPVLKCASPLNVLKSAY